MKAPLRKNSDSYSSAFGTKLERGFVATGYNQSIDALHEWIDKAPILEVIKEAGVWLPENTQSLTEYRKGIAENIKKLLKGEK